jgi:enoyl-CoA hydratase
MTVHYEADGPIAVVTLDRPEVANAIDRATAEELIAIFEKFDADPDMNVAILQGANGKFCAGADLKAISTGQGNRLAPDGYGPLGVTRMELSKPVIAAVEGHAVAGGLELSLWCDMRVAARDATFGVYCRRWGVPLCDGGTVRLPRIVGMSRAMDMILTGRGVSGEEAYAWGLANRLCEAGQALATARDLAALLARLPQGCMRSDKKSAYLQWDMTLADALRQETEMGIKVVMSGETMAGVGKWVGGEWSFKEFTPG